MVSTPCGSRVDWEVHVRGCMLVEVEVADLTVGDRISGGRCGIGLVQMVMGSGLTYDAALVACRSTRVFVVALLIDVEINGPVGGFERDDPRVGVRNPRWHRDGGRACFQKLEDVLVKRPAEHWLGPREPWGRSAHEFELARVPRDEWH